MKETVSIIIPIYNSEPYLSRCIDSLLAQTYTNIEVLLIDDGSTDCSYEICQQYVQRDNRVQVIKQENKGASAARNTGLDHATGDFVMFCDSDDIVSAMWIERLLNYLSNKLLVVMPISHIVTENSLLDKRLESNIDMNVFIPKCQLFSKKIFTLIGFAVNTVFYRSIIEENKIRFRIQKNKADYNEDLLFVTNYLSYVDGFVYTGYADYAYLTREDSLSRSFTPFYFEKYKEKFEIWYNIARDINDESAINEIATIFLYRFLVALQDASFKSEKDKFIHIVLSDSTQKCISYADTSKEDARAVRLLKEKKCNALWYYYKVISVKNKFKHK